MSAASPGRQAWRARAQGAFFLLLLLAMVFLQYVTVSNFPPHVIDITDTVTYGQAVSRLPVHGTIVAKPLGRLSSVTLLPLGPVMRRAVMQTWQKKGDWSLAIARLVVPYRDERANHVSFAVYNTCAWFLCVGVFGLGVRRFKRTAVAGRLGGVIRRWFPVRPWIISTALVLWYLSYLLDLGPGEVKSGAARQALSGAAILLLLSLGVILFRRVRPVVLRSEVEQRKALMAFRALAVVTGSAILSVAVWLIVRFP
jgi:hypothetical protein